MSNVDKIILAAVVLQAVYAFYKRATGQANRREVDKALAPPPKANLDAWLAALRARVAAHQSEAESLNARTRAVILTLQGDAPRLAEAASKRLVPGLDQVRHQLGRVQSTLETGDAAAIQKIETEPDGLGGIIGRLQQHRAAVVALESEAKWRVRPGQPDALAQGEHLMGALLAPMGDFLSLRGSLALSGLPLAVTHLSPAWEALLPGIPVLAVPDDLQEDPLRWGEVAYGAGEFIRRHAPGFAHEIRMLFPLDGPTPLPLVHQRQLHFDLGAAVAAWMPVLVNDALTILLLGPAGLRGLVHALKNPRSPQAVVAVAAAPDGQHLGSLPPAHLRVILAAWFLERIGFVREPEALRREWQSLHNEPDALVLPSLTGDQLGLTLAPFRVRGQQALELFYTSTWVAFGGHELSSIPGFEMSPGLWARVRTRTRDLTEDQPFKDDARIAVAAAIEAMVAHVGAEARITRGLRRAIISTTGRTAPTESATLSPPADGHLTLSDLRDAMVVSALMGTRKHARRR